MQFDSPNSVILPIKSVVGKNADILRPRIYRREVEHGRPCNQQPCDFGELTNEIRQRVSKAERQYIERK